MHNKSKKTGATKVKKEAKKMQPGTFQGCPVPGQETAGTDWNTRVYVRTSALVYCEGDKALSQVTQRGCEVFPLGDDDFKSLQDMVLGNLIQVSCLSRGVGLYLYL